MELRNAKRNKIYDKVCFYEPCSKEFNTHDLEQKYCGKACGTRDAKLKRELSEDCRIWSGKHLETIFVTDEDCLV